MLQQIADSKADASVIEDKILLLMEQSDAIKVKVEEEKRRLKEEEKGFLGEKQKVDLKLKEIETSLTQLRAQKAHASEPIDKKVLLAYERILASRDGLAIVSAKNNSCGGCNMFVPSQVINLIRMYENIVTCESCNRILYVDEKQNG